MNKKTKENDEQLPSVSLKDLLNEKGVISQYKDIDKPKKRFIPPTFHDVYDYCIERGNNINPQKFIQRSVKPKNL